MRITNTMINFNTKNNINATKVDVDTYNTQMSSKKKIQNPSDDPVIAIRALRLRSTLNQINQYYERNIPDAQSWLEATETALINVKDLVTDIYNQCVYGSNDSLKEDDRDAILKNLKQLREQIYSEGNSDYAGRTVFTGYKTNKTLTFPANDKEVSYTITEDFTPADVDEITYLKNKTEVVYGNIDRIDESDLPEAVEVNRIRLAYNKLDVPADATLKLKYKDIATDTDKEIDVEVKSIEGLTQADIDALYPPAADKAYFIPETGEILLGSDLAKTLQGDVENISFTYDKTGFEKDELMPEHFFTCEQRKNVSGNVVTTSFTKESNPIEYTVSFNQSIKINTEASEFLSADMKRDLDDLISSLQASVDADKKIADIKTMMADSRYSGEEDQKKLETMLEAAEKEKAYADDYVHNLFEKNVGVWQDNLNNVNLALTDCGSRASRLKLTYTRMGSQQTTFQKLKSSNEDRDISDIIIDYTAAYTAYQSSLTAASKANSQTLLNFI